MLRHVSSRPITITQEQFLSLQHGDVILWKGFRKRTVIIGPADHVTPTLNCGLVLPISWRSWTNRAYTVLGWTDLKFIIQWTGKRAKCVMNQDEARRLIDHRFDIRAEIERETSGEYSTLTGRSNLNPLRCKSIPTFQTL